MCESISSLVLDKARELLFSKFEEKVRTTINKCTADNKIDKYYVSIFEEITASIPDEWEQEQILDYITKFAPIQVGPHYSMFSDEMRDTFIEAFYDYSSLHYRSNGIEISLRKYLDGLEQYLSFELKDKLFFEKLEGLSSGQERIENSVQEVLQRLPNPTSSNGRVSAESIPVEEIRIKPDINHSKRESHVILRHAFDLQMEGAFEEIIKLTEDAIEKENSEQHPDVHTLLYAKQFLVHYYLALNKHHEKASEIIDEILAFEIVKSDPIFYRDTLLSKAKLFLEQGKISPARVVLKLVDAIPNLTKNSLYYEVFGMVSFHEGDLSSTETYFIAGRDVALGQYCTAVDPEEKASHLQHYWAFLSHLGQTYRTIARPDLALHMWEKAIDASANLHFQRHKTICVLSYVECLLQYERWSDVFVCLDRLKDTLLSIADSDLLYQYYHLKADAFLGIGDSDSAINTLTELMNFGLTPTSAITVLQRIAAIEASQGKQQAALETLHSAKQLAEKTNQDHVGGISVQEANIKESRMFIDGKIRPSIIPPDSKKLLPLMTRFNTSEDALERLQLAFEIGISQVDSNARDANNWLSQVIQIARKLGNRYLEARALIAKVSILFASENEQAEIDAGNMIDTAIDLVQELPFWDVHARLMMFKGMSCAHLENFDEALCWFSKASDVYNTHKVHDQILADCISDFSDACHDILSRKQYTDIDFDTLIQEISFFNSRLPNYRKEMIQFLWYNRHEDLERLIISSHGSKALMVSDNAEDIQNWTNQLGFLFDTVSFCSQSDYCTEDNWNFAKLLPLPENMAIKFFNMFIVMDAQ